VAETHSPQPASSLWPRDRIVVAARLSAAATVLLVLFAAGLLNAALPLRPADPRWLQGLIQATVSQGFLPLLALVLQQLALVLDPERRRWRNRSERSASLALIAALGFLLLLPLQLHTSWASLNSVAAGQQARSRELVTRLRQEINASTSHEELERRIAALPVSIAGGNAEARNQPFRQRQQTLLAGLERSASRSPAGAAPATPPWPVVAEPSLRLAPAALALAAGFAAFGLRRRTD